MRILVIEDDSRVASFIRRGLSADKFLVDVAHDGPSGLELAVSKDYSLIVLDPMLPGLTGQQVLDSLRKTNRTVPVVVLTARGAIQDKVELFHKGCDDYVTKPFAFAGSIRRVPGKLAEVVSVFPSADPFAKGTAEGSKLRVTLAEAVHSA